MEEINERLDQVKEELRLYKKWTKQHESIRTDIDAAKAKLNHPGRQTPEGK